MRVVIDIEADALVNPKHIWLIVCKDIDTGQYHIFRNLTKDEEERRRWVVFKRTVSSWIGHNILGYDIPVLASLLDFDTTGICERCTDTLILSKLIDYSRSGHSIEDYGLEFGIPKGKFVDFSKYSKEMEDYCVRDVDICEKIYRKYLKYASNPNHYASILLEHQFQIVVNDLHSNGFSFNTTRASSLLSRVEEDLQALDKDILEAFPPRLKLIKEITPKATKYGTISKTSIPRSLVENISDFTVDAPFSHCVWTSFNPSSHKQIVDILNEAHWRPVDKTQTHIDTERALSRLKYKKSETSALDLTKEELILKLNHLKTTGWKVNENNLETLPVNAPSAARLLARRILLEARRRTLVEWLNLIHFSIKVEKKSIKTIGGVKITEGANGILSSITDLPSKIMIAWLQSRKVNVVSASENESLLLITVTPPEKFDGSYAEGVIQLLDGMKPTGLKYTIISERIKGKFIGLGAWTHRMAHQAPNTANIPNEYDTAGKRKLLGKELRSLWCAPKNRLLVGVDAEGIQLRIFAHLINDLEFTEALIKGKKDDKTDPHSLNQRILGRVCRSRAAAKRFIYALLLGAGLGKLAEILGCIEAEAKEALDRLMERYTGWARLKEEVFPKDAKRGWFVGLDGRRVRIPGETEGSRRHLAMSGYLQNGETVVMKLATLKWVAKLKEYDALLVNFVHDEWQVECPNNMSTALTIAEMMATSLKNVGQDLQLNCPLAGSYWNDDLKDYTIHTNWSKTH